MQDYRAWDGNYYYEPVSNHPAYLFRMSARDLARFGWLYLNNGRWQEKQIIPANWIVESVQPLSDTELGDSYGYLWWVFRDKPYNGYYAEGGNTQMLAVLPSQNIVFVHLSNTFEGQVSRENTLHLLDLLLQAQTGQAVTNPVLIPLPKLAPPEPLTTLSTETLKPLAQTFRYPNGQKIDITLLDGQLVMDFGFGQFGLLPLSETEFLVEDTYERVIFTHPESGPLELIYEPLQSNPFKAVTLSGSAIALPPS